MRRAMWAALTRQAVEREGWKDWSRLRYAGDKTTVHFCTHADEIHRTFPDARFLHMLRIFKVKSPMSMGTWGLVSFSFTCKL